MRQVHPGIAEPGHYASLVMIFALSPHGILDQVEENVIRMCFGFGFKVEKYLSCCHCHQYSFQRCDCSSSCFVGIDVSSCVDSFCNGTICKNDPIRAGNTPEAAAIHISSAWAWSPDTWQGNWTASRLSASQPDCWRLVSKTR